MKLRNAVWVAVAAGMLVACSSSDDTSPTSTAAIVGSEGGEVSTAAASIVIPANALDQDVEISLSTLSSAQELPSDTTQAGDVIGIQPYGLTLEVPARVSIPARDSANHVLTREDEHDVTWEAIDEVIFSNGRATFSTHVLGIFTPVHGEEQSTSYGTGGAGSETGNTATGGDGAGGDGTGGSETGGADTGGSDSGGSSGSGGDGGAAAVGGSGGASSGGSATGGSATGGSATGGSATGGSATGGSATGGSATGGSATGGSATGGSATGGSATGGSATGGSATGGSGMGGASSTGGSGGVAGAGGSAGTSGECSHPGYDVAQPCTTQLPTYCCEEMNACDDAGNCPYVIMCATSSSSLASCLTLYEVDVESTEASAVLAVVDCMNSASVDLADACTLPTDTVAL